MTAHDIALATRAHRVAKDAEREEQMQRCIPLVPMPVDLMDEAQFPELAKARAHLASLSPARRAFLESEWL